MKIYLCVRVDLPLDKNAVENQDWAAGPPGLRTAGPPGLLASWSSGRLAAGLLLEKAVRARKSSSPCHQQLSQRILLKTYFKPA